MSRTSHQRGNANEHTPHPAWPPGWGARGTGLRRHHARRACRTPGGSCGQRSRFEPTCRQARIPLSDDGLADRRHEAMHEKMVAAKTREEKSAHIMSDRLPQPAK